MSAGIVCVKARVNIYRKFKFFPAFKPFKPFCLLPSSLPYNTDATGHDIIDDLYSIIDLIFDDRAEESYLDFLP